jgi:hypothetical protein
VLVDLVSTGALPSASLIDFDDTPEHGDSIASDR